MGGRSVRLSGPLTHDLVQDFVGLTFQGLDAGAEYEGSVEIFLNRAITDEELDALRAKDRDRWENRMVARDAAMEVVQTVQAGAGMARLLDPPHPVAGMQAPLPGFR